MHIGRLLCGGADANTAIIFSDWAPRPADNAVMTVEVIHAMQAELKVSVFHKNREETGPGTLAGVLVSATSAQGLHSATLSALRELVRYKIEVKDKSGVGLGGVLYRFLSPTWFNTAQAPGSP